jgi:hypothetical protein
MKRVVLTGLVLMVSMAVFAQDDIVMEDGSRVVLPLAAQACTLPSAPPPIPEVPVKEDMLKAQKNIKQFQAEMVVYRTCLDADIDSGELTKGNVLAITNAHDYSVDMEERVATMFNEALRAYKASIATQ